MGDINMARLMTEEEKKGLNKRVKQKMSFSNIDCRWFRNATNTQIIALIAQRDAIMTENLELRHRLADLIALFEEIQSNGNVGAAQLHAWFLGEQELIRQSIAELEYLKCRREDNR